MSKTVYLVVVDLTEEVDSGIVALFNSRHVGLGELKEGDTYGDMKLLKESLIPIKGAGYMRAKNSVDHWVLPFDSHDAMGNFPDVEVLTSEELNNYGWDVEEEPIQ